MFHNILLGSDRKIFNLQICMQPLTDTSYGNDQDSRNTVFVFR